MSSARPSVPLYLRFTQGSFFLLAVVMIFAGAVGLRVAQELWPDPIVRLDGFTTSRSFLMAQDASGGLVRYDRRGQPYPRRACSIQVRVEFEIQSDGRFDLKIECNASHAVQREANTPYEKTEPVTESLVRGTWPNIRSRWLELEGEATPFEAAFGELDSKRFANPEPEVAAFVNRVFDVGPGRYAAFGSKPAEDKAQSVGLGTLSSALIAAGLGLLALGVRAVVSRRRLVAGRCPVCNFPIEGRPLCTECGFDLGNIAGHMTE